MEKTDILKLCPFCGREPYGILDIISGDNSAAMCTNPICPLNQIFIDIDTWQNRPIENVLYKKIREWQPIETAPKDGTPVLIYEPDEEYSGSGIFIAEWRLEEYIVPSKRQTPLWCVQHTFQDEQGGEVTLYNPTHWMPLPEQPKQKIIFKKESVI